jgi:Uma2 family endonuclease
MASISNNLVTTDELCEMGDIGPCELIYGELVRLSYAGVNEGIVIVRLGSSILDFVEEHGLGMILGSAGFNIESKPDLVRAPDVAFIGKKRLRGPVPKGFMDGVPDLAVEVVSPTDKRREVAEKVNMWLAHGTISVWVVDPETMTVIIHRSAQKPIRLTAKDKIEDEITLPGFVLPLSKIFQQP